MHLLTHFCTGWLLSKDMLFNLLQRIAVAHLRSRMPHRPGPLPCAPLLRLLQESLKEDTLADGQKAQLKVPFPFPIGRNIFWGCERSRRFLVPVPGINNTTGTRIGVGVAVAVLGKRADAKG